MAGIVAASGFRPRPCRASTEGRSYRPSRTGSRRFVARAERDSRCRACRGAGCAFAGDFGAPLHGGEPGREGNAQLLDRQLRGVLDEDDGDIEPAAAAARLGRGGGLVEVTAPAAKIVPAVEDPDVGRTDSSLAAAGGEGLPPSLRAPPSPGVDPLPAPVRTMRNSGGRGRQQDMEMRQEGPPVGVHRAFHATEPDAGVTQRNTALEDVESLEEPVAPFDEAAVMDRREHEGEGQEEAGSVVGFVEGPEHGLAPTVEPPVPTDRTEAGATTTVALRITPPHALEERTQVCRNRSGIGDVTEAFGDGCSLLLPLAHEGRFRIPTTAPTRSLTHWPCGAPDIGRRRRATCVLAVPGHDPMPSTKAAACRRPRRRALPYPDRAWCMSVCMRRSPLAFVLAQAKRQSPRR